MTAVAPAIEPAAAVRRRPVAAVMAGIATPIVIIGLAILPFLTPLWIFPAQARAQADVWTGWPIDTVTDVTGAVLVDLVVGPPSFDELVDERPVFAERERAHLRDVRTAFLGFAAVVLAGIAALVVAWRLARGTGSFRHGVRSGSIVLIAGVVAAGIFSVVAFDAAFSLFHQLLFASGSYTFDPETDKLVQLFPMAFWYETAIALGAVIIVAARRRRLARRTGPPPGARRPGVMDELLSVESARAAVLGAIAGPTEAEVAWTMEALGRVVAEPIASPISLPPWDNSAMDGYAIRAADVAAATEATPVSLEVIGEVRAGQEPEVAVRRGTAIRIATGARLPDGADAVVPVELTTPVDAAGVAVGPRGRDATGPLPAGCLVHVAVPVGGSIRKLASDVAAGTVLVDGGTVVSPATVAVVAGVGVNQLMVHRRPIVGILATGDEIRSPGQALGAAGIPDANGPALVAMVEAAGGEPRVLGVAKDRLDDVKSRLCAGLVEADIVIVSGGVSVGPYDVVRAGFEAYGTIDLWRVAVQPGKPFAFGTAPHDDGRPPTLLFGLPGNPVSTFVTFELFVRPAIRRLAGHRPDDLLRPVDDGILLDGTSKSQGRRGFHRVVAERTADGRPSRDADGRVRLRLAGGQGSHVLSALARADGLAVIPEAAQRGRAGHPGRVMVARPMTHERQTPTTCR